MTEDEEKKKRVDAMAIWLIEHVDAHSIGIASLKDPIGSGVFYTARQVAELLTGYVDVVEGKMSALILEYKLMDKP